MPALLVLQGKRIQDVAFRMHVAQPKPRDRQGRPPVIPAGLAAQRARKDAGEKMRTEKDVEVGCRTLLVTEVAQHGPLLHESWQGWQEATQLLITHVPIDDGAQLLWTSQ